MRAMEVIPLAMLLGSVTSRGVPKSARAAPPLIVQQHSQHFSNGSYSFSYETENGIRVREKGKLKNIGSQEEVQTVQGSYSYTDPDRTMILVNYVADEKGFQAHFRIYPGASKRRALNKPKPKDASKAVVEKSNEPEINAQNKQTFETKMKPDVDEDLEIVIRGEEKEGEIIYRPHEFSSGKELFLDLDY